MRFSVAETPHQELRSLSGEAFSLSAVLSEAVGFKDLFVHHEILPPGRRASGPHAHTHREEMIFVLEGFPVAHLGAKRLELKPGDYVGIAPGGEGLHFIENPSDGEVRLLVVASNPAGDQVRYPRS
jgi:uncharacterized cupin superfamily protein